MAKSQDKVWKALADPTRRQLLDLLRDSPQTTGQLCDRFEMSRYGVMKHLGILEEAGLVIVRREGRKRYNYINAVPIRHIYERWVNKYSEVWASSLLSLKSHVEKK